MVRVEVYGKADCSLCDDAKGVLEEVRKDLPFEIVPVDITLDPAVFARYQHDIPVVFVDGHKAFKHRLTAEEARHRIARAIAEVEGASAAEAPPLGPARQRAVKLAFLAVTVLAVGGVFAGKVHSAYVTQPRLAEAMLELLDTDAQTPVVRIATRDGKGWSAADDRGKVLFVNFWGTFCAPCKDELPSMVKLARELDREHPGQFRMVAVSIDEGWDQIQEFFSGKIPRELFLALDADQKATKAYYCAARGGCPQDFKVPETYVVDKTGRLKGYVVGPRDWSDPAAKRWFERFIDG
jgi:thiol-disulfide isomerase/thioredoxin